MDADINQYNLRQLRELVTRLNLGVSDRSTNGLRNKILALNIPELNLQNGISQITQIEVPSPTTPVQDRRGRYLFKAIVLGSSGVGATTLLSRFSTGMFSGGTRMTIGVDFSVATFETRYGRATLQLWNFAGEERFKTMIPSFCLGSSGCLLLYDPTDSQSFSELREWFSIVRENTSDIPIIIVQTKRDLIDEEVASRFPTDEVNSFIYEHRLPPIMSSSTFTGHNVINMFRMISECMIERNMANYMPNSLLTVHEMVVKFLHEGTLTDLEWELIVREVEPPEIRILELILPVDDPIILKLTNRYKIGDILL